MTPAAADEIRQAVRRFRASGKPVIAHSPGLQARRHGDLQLYGRGRGQSNCGCRTRPASRPTGLSGRDPVPGPRLREIRRRCRVRAALRVQERRQRVHPERLHGRPPRGDDGLDDVDLRQRRWPISRAIARMQPAGPEDDASRPGPIRRQQALSLKLIDKIGQVEEAEAEAKRLAGNGAEIVEFGDYASIQGRAHRLGQRRHRHRRRRGRDPDRARADVGLRRRLVDRVRCDGRGHL